MNEENYPYKSLERIGEILVCLQKNINSVSEIAAYRGLTRSTVSRLLQAMEKTGLVVQDPVNRRYYLGRLIATLTASPQDTHRFLVASAHREMLRLSDLSGEKVFLSITMGIQYVQLQMVFQGPGLSRLEDFRLLGPQLLGATAKALLSQFNRDELELALKYFEVDRQESLTNININTLTRQLEQIKAQGYAVSAGERDIGQIGIAGVIRGYICPAAVSIFGSEESLKPRLEELVREIKKSSETIAALVSG